MYENCKLARHFRCPARVGYSKQDVITLLLLCLDDDFPSNIITRQVTEAGEYLHPLLLYPIRAELDTWRLLFVEAACMNLPGEHRRSPKYMAKGEGGNVWSVRDIDNRAFSSKSK